MNDPRTEPAVLPQPGESAQDYIARRHREAGATRRGCSCPRAYSRCLYAVVYDVATGSPRTHGHGGWGWTGAESDVARARAQHQGEA